MKQPSNVQNKKPVGTENQFEEVLHNAELKITRSRMEVLRLFYKIKKPVTHHYVMDNLPLEENWDRVTIYRTLSEFSEKNILRQLISSDRLSYFELKKENHYHGHFVCNQCGSIECLNEKIITVSFKIEDSKYKIDSYEILLTGICGDCK
jgi:Fur family transcriptional regulator, ferric uptake regulator